MKRSWEERATNELELEAYRNPDVLNDYMEDDRNELADNMCIIVQYANNSERYQAAYGRSEDIVNGAISVYVEANLESKILELRNEEADYLRDQAIDNKIDDMQHRCEGPE